jgi:Fe-S cluster assembly scaffold protein SufB
MIDCFREDFDEHLENIMQFILMCYGLHGENARTMLVSGLCDEIKTNFKLTNNATANVNAEDS